MREGHILGASGLVHGHPDSWARKSHSTEKGPRDLSSSVFPIFHLKSLLNLPLRDSVLKTCCLKQTTLVKHLFSIFSF